jgi:hypothetical protein
MNAYETHAPESHAHEIGAYGKHAREMHAHETRP